MLVFLLFPKKIFVGRAAILRFCDFAIVCLMPTGMWLQAQNGLDNLPKQPAQVLMPLRC